MKMILYRQKLPNVISIKSLTLFWYFQKCPNYNLGAHFLVNYEKGWTRDYLESLFYLDRSIAVAIMF